MRHGTGVKEATVIYNPLIRNWQNLAHKTKVKIVYDNSGSLCRSLFV